MSIGPGSNSARRKTLVFNTGNGTVHARSNARWRISGIVDLERPLGRPKRNLDIAFRLHEADGMPAFLMWALRQASPLHLAPEKSKAYDYSSYTSPCVNLHSQGAWLLVSQLAGIKVLVVDDQEDVRLLVSFVLSTSGADVQECDSAAQALRTMATWRPDVIVSDIAMPEHDGYWLIQHVRLLNPENGGLIPAVALTALTSTEDRSRALSAGFQMHIGKPFLADEVVLAVQMLAG